VGHLDAEDHRQLGFALEAGQKPGVDVDPAVGQRERVQRGIAKDRDSERRPFGAGPRELLDNPGEIRVETRIVVELRPCVELRRLSRGLGPELLLGRPRYEGRLAGGDDRKGARDGEQRDESEAAGASRQAIAQFFSARV
jgi:hypothetical protein